MIQRGLEQEVNSAFFFLFFFFWKVPMKDHLGRDVKSLPCKSRVKGMIISILAQLRNVLQRTLITASLSEQVLVSLTWFSYQWGHCERLRQNPKSMNARRHRLLIIRVLCFILLLLQEGEVSGILSPQRFRAAKRFTLKTI